MKVGIASDSRIIDKEIGDIDKVGKRPQAVTICKNCTHLYI
jgi:hypothetical protein